jgi:sugar phosphate isomerase/epimerase
MTDNSNRFGMYAWFGYELPFPDRIRLIRETGFTATSFWWGEDEDQFRAGKQMMTQLVRDAGLYLEYVHVPFTKAKYLWSDSSSLRKELVDKHIGYVKDCAKYAIPMLVMHVSRHDESQEYAHGIESMKELVHSAEDQGITVAVENTARYDDLAILFQEISSPALRFCFDSSHDWLYGTEKAGILKTYSHLLATTHFSDNDGKRDLHILPGDGVIDWPLIATALPTSYTGYLNLEVTGCRDYHSLSAADFVREAHRRLDKLGLTP